ncbi:MAG: type VI secretion system tip protein VgrG [Planctomycetales bacterium]|nr:type VI secretion system tip protein VgrG [Planctomycetales bacterium]
MIAQYATKPHMGMILKTPLDDTEPLFRLMGLSGVEGISQLFRFQLDLLVENEREKEVDFAKLLGEPICAQLPMDGKQIKFIHGICSRAIQNETDDKFTSFSIDLVPKFWLSTKRSGSRIFQNLTVPQIVAQVLDELGIESNPPVLSATYQPRRFCTQYRETDFNFISRLLEEEGIFYCFEQSSTGHRVTLYDDSSRLSSVPGIDAVFFGGRTEVPRGKYRVSTWQRIQQLRSGRYSLLDYSFEQPNDMLTAQGDPVPEIATGNRKNRLKTRANDRLEIYEFPGGFTHRYENPGPKSDDRKRIAEVRVDQATLPGLSVRSASDCPHLTSGHVFRLVDLANGQADGQYVLTSIKHVARSSGFTEGKTTGYQYYNTFVCIPLAMKYRPPRRTAKPFIQGTQTAVVVGPPGQDIHVDEFSRVMVKFHWDREGDASSGDTSCWVRVGTPWAGAGWGMVHIPRIGHEVILAFEEGDPDQPMIIGSVFNANNRPPKFEDRISSLPGSKTVSGIKTLSTPGGVVGKHFNELHFEDKKGSEEIYLHAERDFRRVVEGTETAQIISGDRRVTVDLGDDALTVKTGDHITKVELGKIESQAMQSIELKVGLSSIRIDPTGVYINGPNVVATGSLMANVNAPLASLTASGIVTVNAPLTNILSSGPLVLKGAMAGMTF